MFLWHVLETHVITFSSAQLSGSRCRRSAAFQEGPGLCCSGGFESGFETFLSFFCSALTSY